MPKYLIVIEMELKIIRVILLMAQEINQQEINYELIKYYYINIY
jgi:hypothetical protein